MKNKPFVSSRTYEHVWYGIYNSLTARLTRCSKPGIRSVVENVDAYFPVISGPLGMQVLHDHKQGSKFLKLP